MRLPSISFVSLRFTPAVEIDDAKLSILPSAFEYILITLSIICEICPRPAASWLETPESSIFPFDAIFIRESTFCCSAMIFFDISGEICPAAFIADDAESVTLINAVSIVSYESSCVLSCCIFDKRMSRTVWPDVIFS